MEHTSIVYSEPISGAAQLGRTLCADAELRRAIVIPVPEPAIEALPYYCANPVYLARQRDYMVKVNFTKANRQEATLEEMLTLGEELHRTTGRPVVFALGHDLGPTGPFERGTPFGKIFRYTAASLDRFLASTVRIGNVSGDSGDENFIVFRLK